MKSSVSWANNDVLSWRDCVSWMQAWSVSNHSAAVITEAHVVRWHHYQLSLFSETLHLPDQLFASLWHHISPTSASLFRPTLAARTAEDRRRPTHSGRRTTLCSNSGHLTAFCALLSYYYYYCCCCCYLRQGGNVFASVCSSVCLSVTGITLAVFERFPQNLIGLWAILLCEGPFQSLDSTYTNVLVLVLVLVRWWAG